MHSMLCFTSEDTHARAPLSSCIYVHVSDSFIHKKTKVSLGDRSPAEQGYMQIPVSLFVDANGKSALLQVR